jgi:hypothetical protein
MFSFSGRHTAARRLPLPSVRRVYALSVERLAVACFLTGRSVFFLSLFLRARRTHARARWSGQPCPRPAAARPPSSPRAGATHPLRKFIAPASRCAPGWPRARAPPPPAPRGSGDAPRASALLSALGTRARAVPLASSSSSGGGGTAAAHGAAQHQEPAASARAAGCRRAAAAVAAAGGVRRSPGGGACVEHWTGRRAAAAAALAAGPRRCCCCGDGGGGLQLRLRDAARCCQGGRARGGQRSVLRWRRRPRSPAAKAKALLLLFCCEGEGEDCGGWRAARARHVVVLGKCSTVRRLARETARNQQELAL